MEMYNTNLNLKKMSAIEISHFVNHIMKLVENKFDFLMILQGGSKLSLI